MSISKNEHKELVLAKLVEEKFQSVYGDLKNAKPSGGGWMLACCPFHEDTNPSCGFNPTTGQWNCFSGCGKGDIFNFLEKQQGVPFKEVLAGLGERLGIDPPQSDGTGTVVYDYQDKDGKLLFQVVRKPGKKFAQRRPNGSGGWEWNLKGVKRVLYRLPEILSRPDDLIYVVEGEQDADRLASLGLLATTSPGGAGKWNQSYSKVLAGRDVIILPDNDAPGREHAVRVARALSGKAKSVRIVELPDLPDKGDVSDWLDAGGDRQQLEKLVEQAVLYTAEPNAPSPGHPAIQVNSRQQVEIFDDAWLAIHASNNPPYLFTNGGRLVRVAVGETAPTIEYLDEPYAYGTLVRVADWIQIKNDKTTDAKPPRELAKEILSRPHPDLPKLDSVITTPVFDDMWRLITEPGYHPEAQLWFHLAEGEDPYAVSFRPTAEDVQAALSLLLDDLLVDFPFTAESDRAHAVAAILLPFARRMFEGPTPIHLVEAPTPGSGKSLLAELISIIARGFSPGCTTLTSNEEESRKKLTALLCRGSSVISVDNLKGGLESSQVAAAITTEVWEDRILGQTRMVTLANRALWLVSANNPKLSMEIARRCVRIRIDPGDEKPWLRTGFKHPHIKQWAKQNRQALVSAILTLIQDWIVKGSPTSNQTMGSFENWSQIIGGMVGHFGLPGFLTGTDEFYEAADPEASEWRAFVNVWREKYGGTPLTTATLLDLARSQSLIPFAYAGSTDNARLAKFGKTISQIRDRRFGDDRVVVTKNKKRGSNDYRLVGQTGDLFKSQEQDKC